MEVVTNVPKKRGRRPKYLTLKMNENSLVENTIKEPTVKKKRGRKPKNMHIVKQIPPSTNIQSSIMVKDVLILHVPVNLDKIKKNNIKSNIATNIETNIDLNDKYEYSEFLDDNKLLDDKTKIIPFDPHGDSQYMNVESNFEIKNSNNNDNDTYTNNLNYSNKDIIIPFKSKDINTLCFWDLHTYKTVSYVLPISNTKSIGHFCSLECAAAYNFQELNNCNSWERYSLLHYIYNINTRIKVAPSRMLLNLFGGPLNIDEYRELSQNKNMNININIPPLTNIDMQLDISNDKLNVTNNFVPLTNKRLTEAQHNISKSTNNNNYNNTLDKCINIINNSNLNGESKCNGDHVTTL
jgi:hypothetical protein